MKTLKNLMNSRILLVFLIIAISSCKQENTSKKLQASSPGWENKAELKTDSLDYKIKELMTKHKVPGVNIAFIENGELSSTRNYGVLQKGGTERVTNETIFSIGSLSKVVNAILTLKLVKAGKLDLDTDINKYLVDWKVEQNRFTKNNPVTLRHILSHTSGFSVHGFDDFYPGEKLPTTLEILTGTSPAKNEKVKLLFSPGSKFQYSGGGITVIQKIIEDVTGLPYHEAASQLLFEPLGLKRMTLENPLPANYGNIAKAHDEKGNPVSLPRGYQAMPEKAASGLWASVDDLAILLAKLLEVGKNETSEFLTPEIIEDMITKENNSEYGLGPTIITNYKNYKIIEHNGSNDSYKATFSLFWHERKGYVAFTNGSNGLKLLLDDLRPILDDYLNIL